MKPDLHKRNIILGFRPKRTTWEGEFCFFGKCGYQTKKLILDQHKYKIPFSLK